MIFKNSEWHIYGGSLIGIENPGNKNIKILNFVFSVTSYLHQNINSQTQNMIIKNREVETVSRISKWGYKLAV